MCFFINYYNKIKMKEIIKKMSAMLTVLAVAIIACFSMTSCSDDEPDSEIIYSMGISEMSSSSLEMLNEMNAIYDAFHKAVGVNENTFTMKGNASDCNKKVKAACEKAELSLKDNTWTGQYTFSVTNVNTKEVIYEHTFSKDGNFIF